MNRRSRYNFSSLRASPPKAAGEAISKNRLLRRFAPRNDGALSLLDKRILNRLQEDIPFKEKPWASIARDIGVTEELLIKRIVFLKNKGMIRRISAGFSPQKVNFVSTLAAVKTTPGKIGTAAKMINLYPEVTHNYRRSGPYDLWFTLVAKERRRIAHIIRAIKRDKNIVRLAEFPAVKTFKINVKLHV